MERESESDSEAYGTVRRRTGRDDTGEDSDTDVDVPETAALMTSKDNSTGMTRAKCYAGYVLALLLIAYLLNQLDRYALAIVTQPMAQDIHYGDQSCLYSDTVPDPDKAEVKCIDILDKESCESRTIDNGTITPCKWDYNGNGFQYQILVGPVFILIYTFMGIPLSYAADKTNRKNLLAICLIFWSVMTLLTGFAKEYWHLVILRFGLGIGQAGCTPFAASLITDYFSESSRGTALGFYNWGIYLGYSMAYAIGNFITQANINDQGWRWVFWICGIPGIVHGILIFLSLKEPERKQSFKDPQDSKVDDYTALTLWQKTKVLAKPFISPSLLMICFAGSIRNGAGYVWGYNTQPYFNTYYPAVNVGKWMSWIPLVSGSIGVVFGGFISDRVVKRSGPVARIWVIVISLLTAAPFAALTLLLKPPWAFVCQIPTYIFGEMWVSVTLAVIVELVPSSIKTSVIAVYFFIITNIGGNMPLLVSVIADITSLRISLLILYPGMYVAGALLYVLSLFVLKRDIRKLQENESSGKDPLLEDDSTEAINDTDRQKTYGALDNEHSTAKKKKVPTATLR